MRCFISSSSESCLLPDPTPVCLHNESRPAARIRSCPDDFLVDEIDAFEPSGDGEHVLLRVEKREANTDWVAQQLAKACGVSPRVVSYAGRKDRMAVTTQRFSIQMPGQPSPRPEHIDIDGVRVLEVARHDRKLRTGALAGNRFRLQLRELPEGGFEQLQAGVERLRTGWVANFFGEQRFGQNGRNLDQAQRWLIDGRFKPRRNQKSMLLSAIRSAFFNAALRQRIAARDWMSLRDDDQLQLAGTQSVFPADGSPDLQQRVDSGDVCPALALPGEDSPLVAFAGVEPAHAERWREVLARQRVSAGWRRIAIRPEGLSIAPGDEADSAWLEFSLPAGSFATVVLDQMAAVRESWGQGREDVPA